jgi:TldD protein
MASIASEWKVILIATAGGVVVGDIQPLTRLQVSCIAEENGDRQTGSFGGGGRVEYRYFLEENRVRGVC